MDKRKPWPYPPGRANGSRIVHGGRRPSTLPYHITRVLKPDDLRCSTAEEVKPAAKQTRILPPHWRQHQDHIPGTSGATLRGTKHFDPLSTRPDGNQGIPQWLWTGYKLTFRCPSH